MAYTVFLESVTSIYLSTPCQVPCKLGHSCISYRRSFYMSGKVLNTAGRYYSAVTKPTSEIIVSVDFYVFTTLLFFINVVNLRSSA